VKKNGQKQHSLKLITERVANELDQLHNRIGKLEHALDMVLTHTKINLDTQTICLLQELDMLRQATGVLSDFLHHVAKETDESGNTSICRAYSGIKLRDMADRLSGNTPPSKISGQADLF